MARRTTKTTTSSSSTSSRTSTPAPASRGLLGWLWDLHAIPVKALLEHWRDYDPFGPQVLEGWSITPTRSRSRTRGRGRPDPDAPPGWLGALLGHGYVVQSLISEYMRKRAHISWDYKLDEGSHGHVEHPPSRWAHSWCEFPPPVTIRHDFLTSQGKSNFGRWEVWNTSAYNDYLAETRPISDRFVHFNSVYVDAKDRYKGCQFELGLSSQYKGIIKLPAYRDESYRDRWLRYYRCARWIVWAAEMMRIHSGLAMLPGTPPGWAEYCVSWSIGCATKSRYLSRHSLDKRSISTLESSPLLENFADLADLPPALGEEKLDPTYAFKVLQQVMREIPRPGQLASGSELVRPRRLADWAPGADRVAPGYHWNNTEWQKLINYMAKKKLYNSFAWKWVKAVSSVTASLVAYAGAGLGAGLGGAVGGVLGMMIERGLSGLFNVLTTAFLGGTVSGRDFAQLALSIANGATGKSGATEAEALAAWDAAVDYIVENEQWAWGYDLTDALLPSDLEKAAALEEAVTETV